MTEKEVIVLCIKEILLSSSSTNDKSHGHLSQHSFSLNKNLIMGSPKHEQDCKSVYHKDWYYHLEVQKSDHSRIYNLQVKQMPCPINVEANFLSSFIACTDCGKEQIKQTASLQYTVNENFTQKHQSENKTSNQYN